MAVKNFALKLNKTGEKYNSSEFLKALLGDKERTLKPLYLQLKSGYLGFMSKYTKDEQLLLDSYHEAFIAFYEYCLQGKYDPQKSSPKTMIYMMGRAYLINRLKKEQRINKGIKEKIDTDIQTSMDLQVNFEIDGQSQRVQKALAVLGEKCRELLKLFYYRNLTLGDIKDEMQYKNENVVSSHKSRCLKQLREMLKEEKA
jgi:RNA polymerase sigma factor (sigma-70 family)